MVFDANKMDEKMGKNVSTNLLAIQPIRGLPLFGPI